jgi:hypothetical protein
MLSVSIVPEISHSGGPITKVVQSQGDNRRRYRTDRNAKSGDNCPRRRFGIRPAVSTAVACPTDTPSTRLETRSHRAEPLRPFTT